MKWMLTITAASPDCKLALQQQIAKYTVFLDWYYNISSCRYFGLVLLLLNSFIDLIIFSLFVSNSCKQQTVMFTPRSYNLSKFVRSVKSPLIVKYRYVSIIYINYRCHTIIYMYCGYSFFSTSNITSPGSNEVIVSIKSRFCNCKDAQVNNILCSILYILYYWYEGLQRTIFQSYSYLVYIYYTLYFIDWWHWYWQSHCCGF